LDGHSAKVNHFELALLKHARLIGLLEALENNIRCRPV